MGSMLDVSGGCLGSVWEVFWGVFGKCFEDFSGVFRGCFRDVSRMFWRCFNGASGAPLALIHVCGAFGTFPFLYSPSFLVENRSLMRIGARIFLHLLSIAEDVESIERFWRHDVHAPLRARSDDLIPKAPQTWI